MDIAFTALFGNPDEMDTQTAISLLKVMKSEYEQKDEVLAKSFDALQVDGLEKPSTILDNFRLSFSKALDMAIKALELEANHESLPTDNDA